MFKSIHQKGGTRKRAWGMHHVDHLPKGSKREQDVDVSWNEKERSSKGRKKRNKS